MNPPPEQRPGARVSKYDKLLSEHDIRVLRANPGRWARIATGLNEKYYAGIISWAKRRGYQYATRTRADLHGTFDLYVRYIYPEDES